MFNTKLVYLFLSMASITGILEAWEDEAQPITIFSREPFGTVYPLYLLYVWF